MRACIVIAIRGAAIVRLFCVPWRVIIRTGVIGLVRREGDGNIASPGAMRTVTTSTSATASAVRFWSRLVVGKERKARESPPVECGKDGLAPIIPGNTVENSTNDSYSDAYRHKRRGYRNCNFGA